METAALYFVILALCTTGLNNAAKLPETFERCKRKDPNLNECLRSAIQKSTNDLKPGIPSLQLLPFDPIDITKIEIEEGAGGPVSLKLILSNVKCHGLSSAIVDDVRTDLDKRIIEMNLSLPLGDLEADYEMDGKFLIIPMKGKGKCRFEFRGLKANLTIMAEEKKKDGKSYWNIVKCEALQKSLELLHVNFENLFNGDKTLGENTNKVLNENWKTFWEELKPSFRETFSQVFYNIANVIFSKVPENDIFLD